MQNTGNIQRNSQRRTPTAEGDPRNYSNYPTPPATSQQAINGPSTSSRGSTGSTGASNRSSSGRKRDPSQQLSQIEKSVTHLLIATKQLLETLTQWSRHQATEGEVSDVYVRLGYEFNIACRAFTSIGVDVSDLGNVPDLLRAILEDTLSQDPSPASLDRYLPRIRDIIINLLHGLKRKQQKLRAKQAKDGSIGGSRQMGVVAGEFSANGGAYDENQTRASGSYSAQSDDAFGRSHMSTAEGNIPQRTSSVPTHMKPQPEPPEATQAGGSLRDSRRGPPPSGSESSLSSEIMQAIPVQPPEDPLPPLPVLEPLPPPPPPPSNVSDIIPKDFPAPPPVPTAQPRAQDALAALQRGGDLERRASRRYSAYQIQKHLGQSPSAMTMIPPAQHGPIPNRGKEQRDSLNAVRSRSSLVRQRSSRFADGSPQRTGTLSKRLSSEQNALLEPAQPQEQKREGSPLARQAHSAQPSSSTKESMRATLTGPLDLSNADYLADANQQALTPVEKDIKQEVDSAVAATASETEHLDQPFVPNQSPEPGSALTLFLQYKSKIKKYVLPDGANDLTVARLQLAFIEKFSWHTQNNGVDLPEIYVQDPVSGVRHELEDLSDVRDRTVLVLNVEAVDEVKRHFDSQLGGIREAIDSMRNVVETQQTSLHQVTTRQEESAKEIARIATGSGTFPRSSSSGKPQANGTRALSGGQMVEIQTLRRDLAIMRQTLSSFTSGISTSMNTIRDKAASVKALTASTIKPSPEGESGRAYVNAGKKTVGDDSEELVNRVDDLQDTVEELRKDVTRGVRPLPGKLEDVTRDVTNAGEMLKKMKDMVRREKPTWTKIWEQELELVCNDREFLTLQEELIADLEDDLEKATQTLALVGEATKQQQQQQQSGNGATLRSTSRGFGADTALDPEIAREGVMGEVRALQPNHESRLEAIERAERARAKELEGRKDGVFTKELGNFVEEGKLRKTGGFEEIERMRLVQDQRNLGTAWTVEQEEKARRKKERAEKKKREAEERARIAAEEAAEEGMTNEEFMHDPPPEGDDNGRNTGLDAQPYDQGDEALQNGTNSDVHNADGQRKSWLPSIFSGAS